MLSAGSDTMHPIPELSYVRERVEGSPVGGNYVPGWTVQKGRAQSHGQGPSPYDARNCSVLEEVQNH